MKILIAASTLPRWPGDAVPAFVLDQAIALQAAGLELEPILVAPHHAGAATHERLAGVETYRFRYFWPESLQRLVYPAILPNLRRRPWLALQIPFLVIAEFFAMLRLARRLRPDVIYSHWFMPQAVAGAAVGWLLGIPHVFTSHSSDVQVVARLPLLGPPLVRAITRRTRAFTAVSRRTLARLQTVFGDEEWRSISDRAAVISMGVDLQSLAPAAAGDRRRAREALGLDDSPVLLFMGRLTAKKGLADLMHAQRELLDGGTDCTLLVAGDGELRAGLRALVTELRLDENVRMLGYVSGDDKTRCLAAADILVVPSIVTTDQDAEGLPVTLLEGLAAGKLCVATTVSGAEEILVDHQDGFLAPPGQPDALASVLAGIMALDTAERAAVQARARTRAEQFAWPIVARAHYRHLFSASRGGARAPSVTA